MQVKKTRSCSLEGVKSTVNVIKKSLIKPYLIDLFYARIK